MRRPRTDGKARNEGLAPRKPVYLVIKDAVIGEIVARRFKPGEMLPSIRELAQRFGASALTVFHAVKELAREDWVVRLPKRGVMVAKTLPPFSPARESSVPPPVAETMHDVHFSVPERRPLRCAVYDERLIEPLARAANAFTEREKFTRIEVVDRSGNDRILKFTDTDIELLPTYVMNNPRRRGALLPANGIVHKGTIASLAVLPSMLGLASRNGLWGMPVFAGGPFIFTDAATTERLPLSPMNGYSGSELIDAIAVLATAPPGDGRYRYVMDVHHLISFVLATGEDIPAIVSAPAVFEAPSVREVMEKVRTIASSEHVRLYAPGTSVTEPHEAFMLDANTSGAVIAKLDGTRRLVPYFSNTHGFALIAPYCLCVNARTRYPIEAWEWVCSFAHEERQLEFAEARFDIPVSSRDTVWQRFGEKVGTENAAAFRAMLERPSTLYGLADEDLVTYFWEVLHYEMFRFIAGMDDYHEFLRRLEVKTNHYLR